MKSAARVAAVAVVGAGLTVAAVSRRAAIGRIESGEGDGIGAFSIGELAGDIRALWDRLTAGEANVDTSTAARNQRAFLAVLRRAEGTSQAADPYRVCFGYSYTIRSMADHPAITGEWLGQVLPDAMCINAGFSAGCRSTAAGAYQIIKPTWQRLRSKLALDDFGAANQDRAALALIEARGALTDVQAGRFADAVGKCRNEWASLPGNYAAQGQRSLAQLAVWFGEAGGEVSA